MENSRVASVKTPEESEIAFNPNNFSNYFAQKVNPLNASHIVTPTNHNPGITNHRQSMVPENPFGPKSRTQTSSSFIAGLEGLNHVRKQSTTITNLNNHRPPALNRIRGVTSYATGGQGHQLGKSQVNLGANYQIEE
jgi:hypothetical protein